MSYEGRMLKKLNMPARNDVEKTLIIALFNNEGSIKEFSSGENTVEELADYYNLSIEQRTAFLETVYQKENRVKKSLLWHRLLYRAADNLAKEKLITRPTQTLKITQKREWMLTEYGFDKALKLLNIPKSKKSLLPTKSFEVQKIVKKLNQSKRPENYNPLDKGEKISKVSKETTIRERGFRLAVIEAYNHECAVCGLKIHSPDSLYWEVEAAHIVPKREKGKDDIWNGLALCRLHHWAFDVGWFTILDNYKIQLSSKVQKLMPNYGQIGDYEFLRTLKRLTIKLPSNTVIYPHINSIKWHRLNVFHS